MMCRVIWLPKAKQWISKVGQSIEKLYKLVQDVRRIIIIDNDLTDLNIEWIKAFVRINYSLLFTTLSDPRKSQKSALLICHFRKDIQRVIRTLKTDFPELRIKKYHDKSDPVKKTHDFSHVEEYGKT
ncbi:hypothetical protein C1646_762445 [Rhizophagus diaphanus]|nr:hypothetical protein C1646_762445 [Rhizophagus diaphanus] [Rhizophagus sp. MUCL 43196]